MTVKSTVLIIDDEDDIRKILAKTLHTAGYQVLSASHGIEGIEKAKEFQPAIILLDRMMPGLDGMQVKEKLGADELTKDIPVIFLTARAATQDKVIGLRSGVDDYISKPFEAEELIARIESVIARRGRYEKLALTDPLTGLSNVHVFKKEFETFFNMAKRYGRKFSIAVIDLDDLKMINDNYGHQAGDAVLRAVGQLLKQVFRGAEFIVRYGGDEFVVLFPETAEPEALRAVERFRHEILSMKIEIGPDHKKISASVSVGVTGYAEEFADSQKLFEAADNRMYQEKFSKKSESFRGRKILVVEDEEDISKPILFRLRKMGFAVTHADTGEKALDEAEKIKPDLILLDLMLPGISGEEVCKKVRESADEFFSKTPIIMLTAKNSEADRIVGKVIGANCYMAKPYDLDELLHNILRFIRIPVDSNPK